MHIGAVRQYIKVTNLVEDIVIFGYGTFLIVKNYSIHALILLNYKFPNAYINVKSEASWFFGDGKGFGEKFVLICAVIGVVHKFVRFIYPIINRIIRNWRKK